MFHHRLACSVFPDVGYRRLFHRVDHSWPEFWSDGVQATSGTRCEEMCRSVGGKVGMGILSSPRWCPWIATADGTPAALASWRAATAPGAQWSIPPTSPRRQIGRAHV